MKVSPMGIVIVIAIVIALSISFPFTTTQAHQNVLHSIDIRQHYILPSGNSSTSYYGFQFPYVYEEPKVPHSVGVQGITGPNVPLQDLGSTGVIGPTVHLGPVGDRNSVVMKSNNATVSVFVYNGTLIPTSRSPSNDAVVTFQNISLYEFYSRITTDGYANFTLPEGWYFITITAPGGSYIGYSGEVDITHSPFKITRYLVPISYSTSSPVDNGLTSSLRSGSINVNFGNGQEAPQVAVNIYNGSGNSPIITEMTNSWGFANYSGLSSAYTYRYFVNGYVQNDTGTVIYGANASGYFSAGSDIYITLNGDTHWNSTVSGSAPQQGYENSISLTGNVVFKGGSVYLSAPFSSSSYTVVFENSIVYLNSTVTLNNMPKLYFSNSTIYALSILNPFGNVGQPTVSSHFNNSVMFLSTVNATAEQFAGSVPGYWLASDSYGSVFEGVNGGQPSSTIVLGHYSQTEFYRMNLTDSEQTGTGYGGIAWTYMNNVLVVNSTFDLINLVVNNSVIRGLYIWHANYLWYNNSNLTFVNYGNQYTGGASIIATHDSFLTLDYPGTSGVGLNPQFINISYSYLNYTPMTASGHWLTLGLESNKLQLYDDYLTAYPNYTVRYDIVNNGAQTFGFTIRGEQDWINYTHFNGLDAMGFFPSGALFYWNFSHDNLSNGWTDQEWNPFEWYTAVELPHMALATFNNVTFWGYHWTMQLWRTQKNHSTDNVVGYFQDQNVPKPPTELWGRLYLNFSTVWNLGAGSNPYAMGPLEGGIGTYFDHDLFLNDPHTLFSLMGTSSWHNGSYASAFGSDLAHAAGYMYVNNSWFLNLTNQTIPINAFIGSGDQGIVTYTNLSNDSFYYYPTALQSYIPTFARPPRSSLNTTGKGYLWPSQTTEYPVYMSYEIPIRTMGGSLSASPEQIQYVYNSSVNQSTYYDTNSWAWVIAPDVNTSNGTPVISFANGLVGGLQPDFIWKGYTYHEAVENNMTYVAADSIFAPPIFVKLSVPAGFGITRVWMYNASSNRDQLIASVLQKTYNSTITIRYNPSRMPLSVVLFENSTAAYNITFLENGLPANTTWSVALNGYVQSSSTREDIFEVMNGTYNYTIQGMANYSAHPLYGQIVIDGASQTVSIAWNRSMTSRYGVTFVETGIPRGVNWSVTFDNITETSKTNRIYFSVFSGLYSYNINEISGYSVTPGYGTLLITNSDAIIYIHFSRVVYQIVFRENGVTDQIWAVTLDNVTEFSTSSFIIFDMPNGTYTYTVQSPQNFSLIGADGRLTVKGAAISVEIVFASRGNVTVVYSNDAIGGMMEALIIALTSASVMIPYAIIRRSRRNSIRIIDKRWRDNGLTRNSKTSVNRDE